MAEITCSGIALALKVPAPLKSIAAHVIRAANSVAANLAEGQGRIGRDRMHFWRIAYASAREVGSHLQLLARAGAVDPRRAARALATFDEVRAMTWRLLNSTRWGRASELANVICGCHRRLPLALSSETVTASVFWPCLCNWTSGIRFRTPIS